MGYLILDYEDVCEEILQTIMTLKFDKLFLFGSSKSGTFALLLAKYLQDKINNEIKVLAFSPKIILHENSIMTDKKKSKHVWSKVQEMNYTKYFSSVEYLKDCKFDADLIYSGDPIYKDFFEDELEIDAVLKNNSHFKKYFLNYPYMSTAHSTFFYFYGHEANYKLLYEIILKSLNNDSLDGWDNLQRRLYE